MLTNTEKVVVRWLGAIGAGLAATAAALSSGQVASIGGDYITITAAVGAGLMAIVTFVTTMSSGFGLGSK